MGITSYLYAAIGGVIAILLLSLFVQTTRLHAAQAKNAMQSVEIQALSGDIKRQNAAIEAAHKATEAAIQAANAAPKIVEKRYAVDVPVAQPNASCDAAMSALRAAAPVLGRLRNHTDASSNR